MPNYQQYQRYRSHPEHKGFKFGKILIFLGILVVLFLIGRTLFISDDKPTTVFSGNQENSNVNSELNANSNANIDANSNMAVNGNSNSNINSSTNTNTAVSGAFSLAKCTTVYSRGSATAKKVSLTFNVGSDKLGDIQKLLDALKATSTAADFFARGDKATSNPDLIAKINDAGFPIFNLSNNYPHFTDLPESGITEQLSNADSAISKITGKTTKPFFRPPYGDTLDSDIVKTITEAGYCPVAWSIDAMDWSADYTAAQSKERVLSKVTNGSIILMQASNSTTAEIITDVINQLKAKGYSIVHLQELLS